MVSRHFQMLLRLRNLWKPKCYLPDEWLTKMIPKKIDRCHSLFMPTNIPKWWKKKREGKRKEKKHFDETPFWKEGKLVTMPRCTNKWSAPNKHWWPPGKMTVSLTKERSKVQDNSHPRSGYHEQGSHSACSLHLYRTPGKGRGALVPIQTDFLQNLKMAGSKSRQLKTFSKRPGCTLWVLVLSQVCSLDKCQFWCTGLVYKS